MNHTFRRLKRRITRHSMISIALVLLASCNSDNDESANTTAVTGTTETSATPATGPPTESSAAPATTIGDPATASSIPSATTEATADPTIGTTATSPPPATRTCTTIASEPADSMKPDAIAFCVDAGESDSERARCIYKQNEVVAKAGLLLEGSGDLAAHQLLLAEVIETIDVVGASPKNQGVELSLYRTHADVDALDAAIALVTEDRELVAAPNYIVGSSPIYIHSPASDPVPIPPTDAIPAMRDARAGEGYTIGFVDTGLDEPGLKPALTTTYGSSPLKMGPAGSNSETGNERTAGHGTFIASIIARVAPGAEIVGIAPPLDPAEARIEFRDAEGKPVFASTTNDFDLAQTITKSFPGTATPLSILNLSLGTYGCAIDDETIPASVKIPVTMPAALLNLDFAYRSPTGDSGLAIVAAAGNHHTQDRFYPAAFADNPCFNTHPEDRDCATVGEPFLFAVGSTASPNPAPASSPPSTSRPSPLVFSNFGSWVSFYARGNDVAGWKPAWTTTAETGPDVLHAAGWHRWSGTSFAAPCAAALAVAESTAARSAGGSIDPLTVLRSYEANIDGGTGLDLGGKIDRSEMTPDRVTGLFATCD